MKPFRKLSLRDIDVRGRKALVRVDFNVPLNETGEVTDDTRIRRSLPTIRYLLDNGASVILMSHLGRPKGKKIAKYSLKPVASALSRLIAAPVTLAGDCIGEEVQHICETMRPGKLVLLENLRFHPQEEENSPDFSRALAALGDFFVNDAFGACHRAHASVYGVPKYLQAVMGFLVEQELEFFGNALFKPQRPFVTIVGGAKVSDKLPMLSNLIEMVDAFIIGGGMCYTFLKAQGVKTGISKLDTAHIELAAETLEAAKNAGVTVYLPFDHVSAKAFAPDAFREITEGSIPDNSMGLDIGPKSARLFAGIAKNAGTVVWNGPLGVFEMEPYSHGTRIVAEAVGECSGTTILAGGDTAAAAAAFGIADKMSHISTGGGASLELLQGKELPGIAVLSERG